MRGNDIDQTHPNGTRRVEVWGEVRANEEVQRTASRVLVHFNRLASLHASRLSELSTLIVERTGDYIEVQQPPTDLHCCS